MEKQGRGRGIRAGASTDYITLLKILGPRLITRWIIPEDPTFLRWSLSGGVGLGVGVGAGVVLELPHAWSGETPFTDLCNQLIHDTLALKQAIAIVA